MNEAPPSQGLVGGKYQLIKKIGKGGMGSVWEARHVSLGTSSAIKFIEAEYANSAEARSRFDKEAKAAATIQSKHAIQIFDHGVTDDGKPYIVMELLLGEPLDKCIERQRLSLQETARILHQVCRGLARAHERGIIHRDLKPENIYLVRSPDDDETIAKVLDFGIAKVSSGPGSSGAITNGTKTGAVLGTPFYMSPEQARGLRNVDHRTDVWSLGVIAFKCITGHLPFDGESIGDLLVKICTSPIPVPSHVMPGLPPGFDMWFARALDRDPERRFSNVTELAEALSQIAGLAPRGPSHFGATPVSGSVQPGMTTPVTGPYSPHHTPPYQTPHGTPQPYVATPQYGPSPNGMTAAPFTAESIPGVASSGRTRLIMTVMIAALALGIGIAIVALKRFPPGAASASASAGAASVATTTVASATPPVTAAPPASTVAPLPVTQPPAPLPVAAEKKKQPQPAAQAVPQQPAPQPPVIVLPPPIVVPQPQAPHPAPNPNAPIAPPEGYGNPTPNTSLPPAPSNNKNRAAGY